MFAQSEWREAPGPQCFPGSLWRSFLPPPPSSSHSSPLHCCRQQRVHVTAHKSQFFFTPSVIITCTVPVLFLPCARLIPFLHVRPSLRTCITLRKSAHRLPVFADLFMKSVWSLSPFSDAQTAVCLPRSHPGRSLLPALRRVLSQSGGNKGLTHIDGDELSSPNLALRTCLTQNLFVCGPLNGPGLLCKPDILVAVLLKWPAACH